MNYHEEQCNEIEALDSIYYGDMEIIEKEPYHKFKIPIKSEEYTIESPEGLACSLIFTYTKTYPDTPPEIDIEDTENFEDVNENDLKQHILEEANNNLGMVMIFTLVSTGQEWLNVQWDNLKREREEGIIRKREAEEEAERKRFEGTRVTVETFLKWRTAFELDTGVNSKREKDAKDNKRLTGKELFLRDTTLNESDLKFLEEGADFVKVDESLFQNLDDLDLDDDDDDDEDYVPGDSDES
uniref:Putative rwd domain protein n=1 Tax=Xenopsylla cheopis TaxID=163159 RepID=A0A6M2DIF8_XENCH